MNFRPFEVRMRLAAPVIISYQRQPHPVHFDGFLTHVYVQLRTGRRFVEPEAAAQIAADLPLARCGGEEWFYCASAWEFTRGGVTADALVLTDSWKHWVREPVGASGRDYWNEGSGIFRNVRKTLVLACAEEAVFRAVGDVDAVAAALEEYHRRWGLALGPKTAQGYGRVSGLEIRPLDRDLSVWREEADRSGTRRVPARYIPLKEAGRLGVSASFVVAGAVRPPYWLGPQVPCAAPDPWRWYPLSLAEPVAPEEAETMEELLEGRGIADDGWD
ncbi:MAG: hypothetical protein ACPLRW_04665 [Moorellales bacterium]